jgi:uncharacterized protein
MPVAGREEEIKILEKQLKLLQSGFVAVYGRRRIGKTYLVRQVYGRQIIFECSGLNEKNTNQQLENFNLALTGVYRKNKNNAVPASWLQAFDLLKQYINTLKNTGKKIIFLDEISWFDTQKSGFKAALDNFWNQYASKRNDIVLVICGSAASWIINKVINDRGGLHNRITCSLPMQPFTLKETAEFLKLRKIDLVYKDIVQLYMVTGGVPFYLNDIEQGESVPQIIQRLFFAKTAPLKNEFDNLYAALFKNSGDHIAVIKALAAKNKGLTRSEIIKHTKLASGGGLTNTLQELIACGFVTTIYPINKTKEDVLYRLLDEYSIFYLKFIDGTAGSRRWLEMFNTNAYKVWCGYAFENVCLRHTEAIKKALGITGITTSEYSWQHKGTPSATGTQIDLLIDRNDNCINLCEAKFYNASFEMNKQYADTLLKKKTIFAAQTKTRKNIFITMVTLQGCQHNKYYNSVVTNELTAAHLFG